MSLKAVLFNFNGVIINDEAIHQELVNNILINENLRPNNNDYKQYCLGKSDRACLKDILANRGRILPDDYIIRLISIKTKAYRQKIEALKTLPLYPNLIEFLTKLQTQGLTIAVVTGALRSEVEFICQKAGIVEYFTVIVGGDALGTSKPQADGYLLAVECLNQRKSPSQFAPFRMSGDRRYFCGHCRS